MSFVRSKTMILSLCPADARCAAKYKSTGAFFQNNKTQVERFFLMVRWKMLSEDDMQKAQTYPGR
ncbi:MAG: hypothetical protein JW913_05505, partial [Chitinispirillaceae bacterium]|nr:hypothetical protein [Chitinispirillaceae bacterium]